MPTTDEQTQPSQHPGEAGAAEPFDGPSGLDDLDNPDSLHDTEHR